MDVCANLFPSKVMTYLLLAGGFICTLLYMAFRQDVKLPGMAWASLVISVELQPKLLSCFPPAFCLHVALTAEQAVLVAWLSPQILPVGSVWGLAPHPWCWLSASDRQHLICLRHSPRGPTLPRVCWGCAQEGPHWECPDPGREGEGAGHCRLCWFERGAPAVVPGTAFTSWEDGGTGITPLGTHGEICLNFSIREGKEENTCARKKEGIVWVL